MTSINKNKNNNEKAIQDTKTINQSGAIAPSFVGLPPHTPQSRSHKPSRYRKPKETIASFGFRPLQGMCSLQAVVGRVYDTTNTLFVGYRSEISRALSRPPSWGYRPTPRQAACVLARSLRSLATALRALGSPRPTAASLRSLRLLVSPCSLFLPLVVRLGFSVFVGARALRFFPAQLFLKQTTNQSGAIAPSFVGLPPHTPPDQSTNLRAETLTRARLASSVARPTACALPFACLRFSPALAPPAS